MLKGLSFVYMAGGNSNFFVVPQITYTEERGKLNLMWAFDERTIWTSNCVPMMASYNKGKHSQIFYCLVDSSFGYID